MLAQTYYLDDTTNRMLNKVPIEKTRNGKTQWRTGVYASACLALLKQNLPDSVTPPTLTQSIIRRLLLFQVNIGHAGEREWLDEILSARDPA